MWSVRCHAATLRPLYLASTLLSSSRRLPCSPTGRDAEAENRFERAKCASPVVRCRRPSLPPSASWPACCAPEVERSGMSTLCLSRPRTALRNPAGLARLHPRALLQPVPPVADRLVGAGWEPRRHRAPARPESARGGGRESVPPAEAARGPRRRCPSSRTAVTMTSSSSADQLIRCRVPSPPSSSPDPSSPARLRIVLAATAPPLEAPPPPPAAPWPPLVRRVLVGGGGGGRSTRGRPAAAASASSSSSRNLFQRLRTESSDRPGKCGAMRRQRMPIRWTQARMVPS